MRWVGVLAGLGLLGCGGSSGAKSETDGPGDGGGGVPPPPAACGPAAAPSEAVAEPTVLLDLTDSWEEGWLGSAAVADLDGDGRAEVVAARANVLVVWNADGSLRFRYENTPGRIWSSPVVANLVGDDALEIAFAAREQLIVVDADGQTVSGFPVSWEDELRSLAAGDLDGDGDLELVVAPARGGPSDVMHAFHGDGSAVSGFPPLGSGSSGCDDACYLAGCFDQNIAVGDLDGDGRHDVVVPHDNAYVSIHHGSGEAFDAAPGFSAIKTPGVRYLHDLAQAQQGWAEDESTALQAHFTNTPPAIADVDGDGTSEVVMLASVQNAAQDQREEGVALWVVRADASRPPGWEVPYHAPDYLDGLWDYGNNMVAITNQVSVAKLDPQRDGPQFVFAGFDGRIHAVDASAQPMWTARYTDRPAAGTAGVAVADLSGDGSPEVVFASYSTEADVSSLFILDAGGNELHRLPLPGRGSMAVPTIADLDGNGPLEIIVSLKDTDEASVRVYTVPGSADNCVQWPTGRGNLLRSGDASFLE